MLIDLYQNKDKPLVALLLPAGSELEDIDEINKNQFSHLHPLHLKKKAKDVNAIFKGTQLAKIKLDLSTQGFSIVEKTIEVGKLP